MSVRSEGKPILFRTYRDPKEALEARAVVGDVELHLRMYVHLMDEGIGDTDFLTIGRSPAG